MATFPPVFGQLEAAVTALPDTYTGKVGYKAWIADAKAKYAEPPPPTDVKTYIDGLKAAGTAFRENREVPPVPMAAVTSTLMGPAGSVNGLDQERSAEAAEAAAAAAAAKAKADAAAAASGMSATTPAWPTNSDIASASEALSAAEPGPTQEAAQTTLSAAKDAAQSELENASEALSAAEPGPAQEAARKRLGDAKRALGLEEGGKRKTRHQTPKRRRSAKSKGRKGLSKKKTGSRK